MITRPVTGCIRADVAGLIVVLTPDGDYVELDQVGAAMWESAKVHADLPGIVAALQDDFDVDEATLIRDVSAFLPQLHTVGLLVVEPSP